MSLRRVEAGMRAMILNRPDYKALGRLRYGALLGSADLTMEFGTG